MDAKTPRLETVDLLRGFVIALMVLDHTRDYFHVSACTLDPTDPARALLASGRTPLFTYVLHIYVVHGSAPLVAVLAGYPASYEANFLGDPVYAAGLAILAVLYPAARWFADVKRRRREWWLKFL